MYALLGNGTDSGPAALDSLWDDLAGNISLNQKLRAGERINDRVWTICARQQTTLHGDTAAKARLNLSQTSKLDCSPDLLSDLTERGERRAGERLTATGI